MTKTTWAVGAAALGAMIALPATQADAKAFRVGATRTITSIQAAVDMASDGDKIIVDAGTYMEPSVGDYAVQATGKALKFIGRSKPGNPVLIVPNAGQSHGILIEGTEENFVENIFVKGFTVQGFSGNGIWLRYVDGFKIDKNTSIDNGNNGIWPTLSANGLVKNNVSYGSDDSALWVEGGQNVRVMKNELYDSVTGLEVTISENVEMKKNTVRNNTVGVGLYHPNGAGLPQPAFITSNDGWELQKNNIFDNNRDNSAPPASLAGSLPKGGGILVFGVDGVRGSRNTVEDNDFYGIALVDYCAGVTGGDGSCENVLPLVQGMPENNRFEKTVLTNNGTNPPSHPLDPYAADLTYILTDIFNDGTYSGPYPLPNVVCGTPTSSFSQSGIPGFPTNGANLLVSSKC